MAGALQADRRQLRQQRVALSDISSEVGLPDGAVSDLRNMGIRSADELLGLIYAAFKDVVNDLNISPQDLRRISRLLRRYIDPKTLQAMDDIYRTDSAFATGGELGPVLNKEKIPDYEKE